MILNWEIFENFKFAIIFYQNLGKTQQNLGAKDIIDYNNNNNNNI